MTSVDGFSRPRRPSRTGCEADADDDHDDTVRIVFASDLHLGITTVEAIKAFARSVGAMAPSVLVLLGDIGEGPSEFERALSILSGMAPLQGLVLGNHDVWAKRGWSSAELLERRLPEIAGEQGFEPIEDRLWRLGDTAIIASMAWYDYSAIDPCFATAPLTEIARRKGDFNNDALRIDWPWSDLEVAARCRESVERRLAEAEADARIRRIIVATHVPIVEEQLTRKPADLSWAFSNAYFGHLTLGASVLRSPKVVEIVSGHTHVGRSAIVPRPPLAPVRARVIGSAYGAPGWVLVEVPRRTIPT